jgi:hypothetical protein
VPPNFVSGALDLVFLIGFLLLVRQDLVFRAASLASRVPVLAPMSYSRAWRLTSFRSCLVPWKAHFVLFLSTAANQ